MLTLRAILFHLNCAIRHARTFVEYRRLMARQCMSRDALMEFNWVRRQALVRHAYETSPFYGNMYRSAGFHPDDLVSPSDWLKVPMLRREHIAEHCEKIVSDTASSGNLIPVTTGGSTGAVLKSYHDRRYPLSIIGWRMLSWWGLDPSVHMAQINRNIGKSQRRMSRLANRLKAYAPKQILLDASSMTESSVQAFLEQYDRIGPSILVGYVGGLNYLAEYLRVTETTIIPPLAVWSTAGPLASVQRSLFEKTFRAPVYDQYGSCEVFSMAAECSRHEGLHINADVRHIDFVDDDGAEVPCGTTGQIAVTDLVNYAFPLIRYLNGDTGHAIQRPCSCGIALPLMGPVSGRISETMLFPNQVAISGEYLTTIFDSTPEAIRAFQVVQRRDASLLVRVVPNVPQNVLAPVLARVSSELQEKTQGCVPIHMESVAEIPSDRGKLRYIIRE